MSRNEPSKCENEDLQPIPKEWQEISTKEIIEADYGVVPSEFEDDEGDEEGQPMRGYRGRMTPPGRTSYDDSIDASSDDPGGTEHGYLFSAGYDSSMATRIGDEENFDPKAERLRELHEGRHRSDGEHSVRESYRDKERLSQSICSVLPLASHERQKVISVVQQIDFSQLGSQKALIKAILGTVAVVIDERERDAESYEDLVSRTDEYRSICDSHEISMSDQSTVKSKVREALDEREVVIPQGEELPNRDPALPGPTALDERPDIYWEEKPSQFWVKIAKNWEHRPAELKEGFPERYREHVDLLRKWEPWKEDEADEAGDVVPETISDEDTSTDEVIESMKEELEKLKDDLSDLKKLEEEIEELAREMDDKPSSND